MIQLRPAAERGQVDLGWLTSRHSFSFGSYYDPRFMGTSVLRVINDDAVAPGAGFDPHSHRDMEILSYVTRGTIEHQDSTGRREQLTAGEFQLMSAGRGITHSEYNAHEDRVLEFLQIWILPEREGLVPGYQQQRFEPRAGLSLVVSPDGRDGSLRINQNASVLRLMLDGGDGASHRLERSRRGYVHVVDGELTLNDRELERGDGAFVDSGAELRFDAAAKAEALVFDLP